MRALLVVDVQNDFLPAGALPVQRGDEVIQVINRIMPRFALVVATQDWHPPGHGSFASQHPGRKVGDVIDLDGLPQILWPDHCVQNTRGAAFAPGLNVARFSHVVQKATDPRIDSYSAFFDNGHRKSTGLGDYLRQQSVREIFIAGLATDYCVRNTALDGRQLGFDVIVILDAVRGVELKPGDSRRALDEMQLAGVRLVREADLNNLVEQTEPTA
jgi:nicotinamidase/pyrazinamidase